MSTPVSTVKNRLQSARARLREDLHPHLYAALEHLHPSMEDCIAERVHAILYRLHRGDAEVAVALRDRHPVLRAGAHGEARKTDVD